MPAVAKKRGKKLEIAASLGITCKCLNEWELAGCPVDRGLAAIRAWRDKNRRPQQGGHGSRNGKARGVQERLLLAQCERTEQQVRAERIANDETEGGLISREDAQFVLNQVCTLIRLRAEDLPDIIAAEMPIEQRESIRELVRDRVTLWLTEMSKARLPGK